MNDFIGKSEHWDSNPRLGFTAQASSRPGRCSDDWQPAATDCHVKERVSKQNVSECSRPRDSNPEPADYRSAALPIEL